MLKKTTLAVLGLAVNGISFAGMYSTPPAPSCTPGDVTVPCEARMWDIGAQALYLQPLYSSVFSTDTTINGNYVDYRPKWGWGYRVAGAYHFNTGNDIAMNWTHYDVDTHFSNLLGTFPVAVLGSIRNIPGSYRLFLNNKYDQLNMVMGQHVDMGLLKNARFYGGLQYAGIRINTKAPFDVPTLALLNATGGVRHLSNSDFNGFGPTIGVDYSYDLYPTLSITANTSTSVLYGFSRFSDDFAYNVGLVAQSRYATKKTIVPGIEAKLGANYAYTTATGTLNIEGGYQVTNYFNAVETRQTLIETHNFGIYGPYFGLKWLGNA